MKNSRFISRATVIGLVICLCLSFAAGCQKPPIKINLISEKISYEPKEPIPMQIRVFNDKTNIFGQKRPVIVRRGFSDQDFHLRITIIDPNGMPVARQHSGAVGEPAPPYRSGKRFLVPVEIIPVGGEYVYFMKDAHEYYRLGEIHGWYTADVRTSLQTFSRYQEGPAGEPYGDLSGWCNRTYDPLTSNKIRFEIAPEKTPIASTIKVHVNLTAAAGGKVALENADVRLYLTSQIPKKYKPLSRKVFGAIWNNVRSQKSTLTDSKGVAVFSGIEQDDYWLLARHPAFARVAITGKPVEKGDARWQAGKVVEFHLSAAP
jgi:hypothetical protein